MRVKIVPKSNPNADGTWMDVPLDAPEMTRKFSEVVAEATRHIPADHYIVQIESRPH